MIDPTNELTPEEVAELNAAMAAMRAVFASHGLPFCMRYWDGEHSVLVYPLGEDVYFSPGGGEFATMMMSIEAKTLQRMLPHLVMAMNIALGVQPESPDAESEEP